MLSTKNLHICIQGASITGLRGERKEGEAVRGRKGGRESEWLDGCRKSGYKKGEWMDEWLNGCRKSGCKKGEWMDEW